MDLLTFTKFILVREFSLAKQFKTKDSLRRGNEIGNRTKALHTTGKVPTVLPVGKMIAKHS